MTELRLLHGFTGAGADWDALLPHLTPPRPTRAPDLLPAEGEAPRFALGSMGALVSDLSAWGGSAAWIGYSMGGRIALSLAAARPDRVRALVLIGASAGIAEPSARAARRAADEALAARIERDGVERFADFWETVPVLRSQAAIAAPAREALRARRRTRSAAGLAACLRGLGTGAMPPLHAALPSIQVPTLLVVGEQDAKFRALAGELEAGLPHARVVVVPGAGHTAHLERPEWVGPVISEFLDRVIPVG